MSESLWVGSSTSRISWEKFETVAGQILAFNWHFYARGVGESFLIKTQSK